MAPLRVWPHLHWSSQWSPLYRSPRSPSPRCTSTFPRSPHLHSPTLPHLHFPTLSPTLVSLSSPSLSSPSLSHVPPLSHAPSLSSHSHVSSLPLPLTPVSYLHSPTLPPLSHSRLPLSSLPPPPFYISTLPHSTQTSTPLSRPRSLPRPRCPLGMGTGRQRGSSPSPRPHLAALAGTDSHAPTPLPSRPAAALAGTGPIDSHRWATRSSSTAWLGPPPSTCRQPILDMGLHLSPRCRSGPSTSTTLAWHAPLPSHWVVPSTASSTLGGHYPWHVHLRHQPGH